MLIKRLSWVVVDWLMWDGDADVMLELKGWKVHAKDIDLNAIYRHCVNFFFFYEYRYILQI